MECIDSSMVSTGESQLDEIARYKTNVLSYYKYMSIAHININSIWNKIEEVGLLLNEGRFHFFTISETKLDSTYNSFHLQHPHYRMLRRDWKKGGGALLVYIRSSVSAYRGSKLEPTDMESICIDVKCHNNSRYIALACYRAPTENKPTDFLPSLYSAAESFYNIRNELLIIGDLNFNMPAAGNSEPDPHLAEFCDRFWMTNTITEPTHVTNCSISLIDLILTSNPERFPLTTLCFSLLQNSTISGKNESLPPKVNAGDPLFTENNSSPKDSPPVSINLSTAIFLCDSNGKFLNKKKLFQPQQQYTFFGCQRIEHANSILENQLHEPPQLICYPYWNK